MTIARDTRAVPARSPSPVYFRHVLLDETQRWRCAVLNRGFGTVVAVTDMVGTPVFYDVELDNGRGFAERFQPSKIRKIADLTVVPNE